MCRFAFLFLGIGMVLVACDDNAAEKTRKLAAEKAKIDRAYPGPALPIEPALSKVISVTEEGALILDDGRAVSLVGVQCPSDIADSLRKLFLRFPSHDSE